MSEKMSEKEKISLERCYFFAEYSQQKEEGTWDCKLAKITVKHTATATLSRQ